MSERICYRCGQILSKWDKICPDCRAVQKSINNKPQIQSIPARSPVNKAKRTYDVLFDDIFDTDVVSKKLKVNVTTATKHFETAKPGRVWFIIGFLIGWICPWIFNIIILITAKNIGKTKPEIWSSMKKGIIWGTVIMQLVLPTVFSIIALLLEGVW